MKFHFFKKLQVALLCGIALIGLTSSASAQSIVAIKTSGNVSNAGTDSDVYIKLFGTEGESKRMRLQDVIKNDSDILEKGDLDLFVHPDKIGPVTKIIVESMGNYAASDWHLDEIKVYTNTTEDPAKSIGFFLIAPTLMNGNKIPQSTLDNLCISTFEHEDWINGDEKYSGGESGRPKSGVELMRKEASAVAIAEGKDEVDSTIYVVFRADALDSQSVVVSSRKYTFTRTESLTLSDQSSDRVKAGLEATVGYQPSDAAGGKYGSVTFSAEYEYIKQNTEEQNWSTISESETDDTFSAQPGTIEFRVLTSNSKLTIQPYRSLLSNKSFTANYLEQSSPFDPEQKTFTHGQLEDDKWDRFIAMAYAISKGKSEYDKMVKKLKDHGILSKPLEYQDAMKKANN